MLAWLSVWSEVQTCWCHCHSLFLASEKSRLVLPFWYRLTQIVLEKRPLNGCSSKITNCTSPFLCYAPKAALTIKWQNTKTVVQRPNPSIQDRRIGDPNFFVVLWSTNYTTLLATCLVNININSPLICTEFCDWPARQVRAADTCPGGQLSEV